MPCQHQKWPGFSVCSGYDQRAGFDYFIDHHTDRELARIGALTVKRRLAKEWGCVTGTATRRQIDGLPNAGHPVAVIYRNSVRSSSPGMAFKSGCTPDDSESLRIRGTPCGESYADVY